MHIPLTLALLLLPLAAEYRMTADWEPGTSYGIGSIVRYDGKQTCSASLMLSL